jgi:hypothetical protein
MPPTRQLLLTRLNNTCCRDDPQEPLHWFLWVSWPPL